MSKKIQKIIAILFCIVMVTTLAVGCGSSGNQDVAKIGAVFSVTKEEKNALMNLEKEINDKGGISGKPVKIVIKDNQDRESQAVLSIKRLAEDSQVVAIASSSSSPLVLDAIKQTEIPVIANDKKSIVDSVSLIIKAMEQAGSDQTKIKDELAKLQ